MVEAEVEIAWPAATPFATDSMLKIQSTRKQERAGGKEMRQIVSRGTLVTGVVPKPHL